MKRSDVGKWDDLKAAPGQACSQAEKMSYYSCGVSFMGDFAEKKEKWRKGVSPHNDVQKSITIPVIVLIVVFYISGNQICRREQEN
jgi:hypothetical protein